MRIAIVRTPEVTAGCGTALTARALTAAGHRVRFLTEVSDDLAAVWSDERPDVVHAIGPVAGRAAVAGGAPVVQAYPADGPGPIPAGRLPDGDRVLASSEDQHAALLRSGVPRASLRTVPAGVDTDTFTPDGPALSRSERPRLVTVGSLASGAGAATAVRALARIRGAELLVAGGSVGDDPDRARLFRIAREAGVAGRVRFLGPVESAVLPRLLRSADVVVAAPGHDVSVSPVLQAMACARPVVAAAVGGLRDAVVDGVTGVHVRPGNPDDLAAALREVLAGETLRLGYGIAGRDRAVSRFDRTRIAGALTEVYAELVDAPAPEPEPSRADPPDDRVVLTDQAGRPSMAGSLPDS